MRAIRETLRSAQICQYSGPTPLKNRALYFNAPGALRCIATHWLLSRPRVASWNQNGYCFQLHQLRAGTRRPVSNGRTRSKLFVMWRGPYCPCRRPIEFQTPNDPRHWHSCRNSAHRLGSRFFSSTPGPKPVESDGGHSRGFQRRADARRNADGSCNEGGKSAGGNQPQLAFDFSLRSKG